MLMTVKLNQFTDPNPDSIGNNAYEFLDFLGGPSVIYLTGKDTSRCRALVTLLHGNEPSGTIALFRWIKSERQPAVNIVCIVASVAAASTEPMFSTRVIEPNRDLNRCFKPPFDDRQGKLAEAILEKLKQHQPEAVIDMHNTSGSGPAFGVVTHMDRQHDALTSLFTQRLLVTHLKLGALMEISEPLFPTVTIECGGRLDEEAHNIAWEGLEKYFTQQDVLCSGDTDWGIELLHNPVRLELKPDCSLTYADELSQDHDLTLITSIEHNNSGITPKDHMLGWVMPDYPNASELFSCRNSQEACVVNELIYIKDHQLLARQDLKLFMVTTNPAIAKMDCLFYAVRSDGSEIVPL